MLRVVVLQRSLVHALCALPQGSSVDLPWLENVWRGKGLAQDWVRRFWKNEKGQRAEWIKRIAVASSADKQTMLDIAAEQMRFRELWQDAPAVTMRKVDWNSAPFDALNKLLKNFYAPLLYSDKGYAFGHTKFDKDLFLQSMPVRERRICPYCDNYLQKTELDHFLPKDEFPFLSCHPDNLIPSCHDSNSGSHKGTTVPLDWNALQQAAEWFHPRLRSAVGRLDVKIEVNADNRLTVILAPSESADVARVDNLDETFRLSEFWSLHIENDLLEISKQVGDALLDENIPPTEETVRTKLNILAKANQRDIGRRGLAICLHAFYRFAANTPAVVGEIVRECQERVLYRGES